LPEWMSGHEGARSIMGHGRPNVWVGRMGGFEDGRVGLEVGLPMKLVVCYVKSLRELCVR
jgi:hypothetical protein